MHEQQVMLVLFPENRIYVHAATKKKKKKKTKKFLLEKGKDKTENG
jgi:hypothetical protein